MPIMALMLPITYHIADPTLSIVLLTSIYYGSAYGGTLSSVVSKVPGDISTAVINQEIIELKSQGRAAEILSTSAISSFISGIIATALIYFLATSVSSLILKFGATQYVILLLVSLSFVILVAKDKAKSISLLSLGMLIGLIGFDSTFGENRFNFGILDGERIPMIAFIMGIYGLSALLIEFNTKQEKITESYNIKLSFPIKNWWATIRGTSIGFIAGLLPGISPVTTATVAYNAEKKLSKDKMKTVASVEASNNSHDQSSIIPLLLIGIPTNGITAIMLAMLLNKGITPGFSFITEHYNMFITIVLSMLLGNIFMVLVNIRMINIWITLLKTPKNILYAIIFALCFTSVYMINQRISDIMFLIIFTIMGYVLKKKEYELVPMLIGFIVAPLLEENVRRAILLL